MAPKKDPSDTNAEVPSRFFTLDQAASYLNVSRPQVYALVRSGELPAIKIGGRGVWRVDKAKLEDYVERLHQETAQWARANPLNPRDAEHDLSADDEPT